MACVLLQIAPNSSSIRSRTGWNGLDRVPGFEPGGRWSSNLSGRAIDTRVLEPADSRLLYDGIRVLTRLLGTARKRLGPQVVVFHDHMVYSLYRRHG